MNKKHDHDDDDDDNNNDENPRTTRREQQKIIMARRALRSLILSLIANITLPITIILLFGSGQRYHDLRNKPVWFPPLWVIHIATVCSSFLMGLAAWLIWADGGFHVDSEALPIYVAQISLNVTWYPLVLVMGLVHIGLFFWGINFAAIVTCYVNFTKFNRIAGSLVKPCVFWAGYLLVVTFKMYLL